MTRIAAYPVWLDGRGVGGVSLVRFAIDRDFSAADRQLLHDVAERCARTIDFGRLADVAGSGTNDGG